MGKGAAGWKRRALFVLTALAALGALALAWHLFTTYPVSDGADAARFLQKQQGEEAQVLAVTEEGGYLAAACRTGTDRDIHLLLLQESPLFPGRYRFFGSGSSNESWCCYSFWDGASKEQLIVVYGDGLPEEADSFRFAVYGHIYGREGLDGPFADIFVLEDVEGHQPPIVHFFDTAGAEVPVEMRDTIVNQ